MSTTAGTRRRVSVRVEGVVQGVGFRPHVFRLAEELSLTGFVLNDVHGVLIEAEGEPAAVARFVALLSEAAPPLARVERVTVEEQAPAALGGECGVAGRSGAGGFAIVASDGDGMADALVAPDAATCDECLAELLDPRDRRHRYPFVNCTNCGPRFTIVRDVPYDRPATTMAGFAMCDACRAEYDDPRDRRFHAQPNACPACGPRVRLVGAVADEGAPRTASEGTARDRIAPCGPRVRLVGAVADEGAPGTASEGTARDSVAAAAALLRDGAIVAVKGIGGYHLACRADSAAAVGALRARKHREDKPFALMVRDLAAARELVELDDTEEALLQSPARPIVLARRRDGGFVADAVAPGSRELGVMLPYTPLHHLLLADAGCALVMTSGNVSDEPIAYRDDDARERLSGIADAFLVHDRPIHIRTDDSIVRVAYGRPRILRRSRGIVPASVPLAIPCERPLLACGAELKSTFCVAKGSRAWVGHHIGDLGEAETLRSFREGVAHFERLFAVRPELVAHDLHPDYHATAYALDRERLGGVELVGVQHHHAHLAACLAEHGETGPAVGAIYDGTGAGADGTVWGGELLAGDLRDFARVGSLAPVRLPGGEAAVREPWRMACAWLVAAGDNGAVEAHPAARAAGDRGAVEPHPAARESAATDAVGSGAARAGDAAAALDAPVPAIPPALAGRVDPARWEAVAQLARRGVAAPVTTSMGRLFDAVAALCGVAAATRASYEGQAAIALEALADRGERGEYELPVLGVRMLDARVTIRALLADLTAGIAPARAATRFHRAVATATARACTAAAAEAGTELVVLSGGVFQNRLLLELTAARLDAAGLRVLIPELLPPNDGGISYGQAAVAAARDRG